MIRPSPAAVYIADKTFVRLFRDDRLEDALGHSGTADVSCGGSAILVWYVDK